MELLIWTENYWIGGCDRFLVDLVAGLRERSVSVTLAGNPHPRFDAWLAARVPWVLPRTVVPVANLVDTPLHRLDRLRRGRGTVAGTAQPQRNRPGTEALPWRAGIAAARHAQAALNRRRLERLFSRLRPDVLLINNGGYPGGESCRAAALAAHNAGVARVVHFVHNMASPPAWPAPIERAYDRRIDAATDQWLTAANRASDALSRERGIARDRVEHRPLRHRRGARRRPGTRTRPCAPSWAGETTSRGWRWWRTSSPARASTCCSTPSLSCATAGSHCRPRSSAMGRCTLASSARIAALGLGTTVRLLGWRDDVDAILAPGDDARAALDRQRVPAVRDPRGDDARAFRSSPRTSPESPRWCSTATPAGWCRLATPASLAAALGELAGRSRPRRGPRPGGTEHVHEHFTLDAMVDAMAAPLGVD